MERDGPSKWTDPDSITSPQGQILPDHDNVPPRFPFCTAPRIDAGALGMGRRCAAADGGWAMMVSASPAGRVAIPLFMLVLGICGIASLWAFFESDSRIAGGGSGISTNVVTVSPDVSGHLTRVEVTRREDVRKGQVLFTVDAARYSHALMRAGAALAQARAALSRTQSALAAITRAGPARQAAQADVAQARDVEQQADALYEMAQVNLARTVVRSPVSGQISSIDFQSGDYVAIGAPVVEIVPADAGGALQPVR
ncbi:biotin/lipoyl-binding protein [Thioclava sp. BHET1]|nr:biotin/lipoyl-binding protein [Thioclava sp. BHET1]